MRLTVCLAWLLVACRPSAPVNPPEPDVTITDAAGPPALKDAAPLSACAIACAQMSSLCAPQPPTCTMALQHASDDKLIRRSDGQPMSCGCVALARTKAAVVVCGVSCP